jgi:hypothetical protein
LDYKKGEFWHLLGPMGLVKVPCLIIEKIQKAAKIFISLVKKGSGENIWDIKKHWLLFNSND